MKYRSCLKYAFCASLLWAGSFAQTDAPEFPTLAPPTPNAIAMHTYGNGAVNFYVGKIDVSIPIFTIKEGDLELPISLSYNGGNGIKLEEQASWVGLGWTLNAGGAVSRTKRGVADEATDGRGFLSYTEVPREKRNTSGSVTNIDFLNDIALGRKDSEPDKFMYSTPTGSGAFFIDYDATIFQKPYKDVGIRYSSGSGNYQDAGFRDCFPAGTMNAFFVTDEYGTAYEFEEKERSNSRNLGGSYYDQSCYPTSWHLTKMKNADGTREIGLEYEPFFYSNTRLTATVSGSNETEGYVEDYFLGKNLKKITFSDGSVEFLTAPNLRKDLENNRALERILIKNGQGVIVKEFLFRYRYFTPNALENDSEALQLGNGNRLALVSVQEISSGTETKPPYRFEYDTDHFLPTTASKAKDHWGFYNGRTDNTKFQAEQLATWYNGIDGEWVTTLIGSADRNPSAEHAQAGILKRVVYPTGGHTDFEYEGNTAVSTELQAPLSNGFESLTVPDNTANIDVELYSSFTEATVMTMRALQYPNGCTPIVRLVDTATDAVREFSFEFADASDIGRSMEHIIAPGNYDVSFYMAENATSCNPSNFDYLISLTWQNESNDPEKDVGGVRIKKVTDVPVRGTPVSRSYNYDNDQGVSSGSIVSAPRYWFQNYSYYAGTQTPFPLSLANRSVSSHYPMVLTSGNTVGYGKVSVTSGDGGNGKTDYYFSSPADFPDKYIGYIQDNGERDDFLFQGRWIRTYPVVTENSREYLRGKLLKQVDYEVSGNTYEKVSETENVYRWMSYDPEEPGQQFAANKSLTVKGINIVPSSLGQTVSSIKENEIHSGYIQLAETVSKQYFEGSVIETRSRNTYPEDADGAITYMMPLYSEVQVDNGAYRRTENFYTFNALSNPDRDPGQDGLIAELADRNRLYESVQTNVYEGTAATGFEVLGKRQQQFKQRGNGAIVTSTVSTQKGIDPLEERLEFVAYDDKGNLLEAVRTDGSPVSYVWGYKSNRLIAKIENAGYDQMSTAQENAIAQAIDAADNDTDANSENTLRQRLETLRTLFPEAMVTTYTYDPLVGVTSITDPRGYTNTYRYDGFDRLKEVRDAAGDRVSDYEYGYKRSND